MINLLHGNCLELMKSIPDGSIDAIITDPPYGTTACKWDSVIPFDLMWEQLNRIIKPNGAIVLFGSEPFSSALRMSNIKNYRYDWVWDKTRGANFQQANFAPMKSTENILVFSKLPAIFTKKGSMIYYPQKQGSEEYISKMGNSGNIVRDKGSNSLKKIETKLKGKFPKTILIFKKDSKNKKHPTQKPVALMEYLIKTYTNESETVLDFTMGSGSTGCAAKNLNRNFIGIEMDDKYFEIASKRINEAEHQTSIF